jgi:SAM-dependent methyltransferase
MDRQGWNQRYASRDFVWAVDANQVVVAEIGHLRPGRALDLGTGEGRNAIWLAERGWRVTAVDFSEVGLDKARRLARKRNIRVRWVLADVTEYRPRRSVYDLVLMCYLQLPRVERERVLTAASAALATGGTFLYIGHDASNLRHGVGGPQDPAVLCTPEDVAARLTGFTIVKAEVLKRQVSAEPGHGGPSEAIALDALVHAVRR